MLKAAFKKFGRQHLPERMLLFAIAAGLIFNGVATKAMTTISDETILRLVFSAAASVALLASLIFTLSRPTMRWIAYCAIAVLISFTAFLCYKSRFSYDDSLAFIGVYLICFLYFRSPRDLLIYFITSLILMYVVGAITPEPHIDTFKFFLRMVVGGLIAFGFSFSTRVVQDRITRISQEMNLRDEQLNKTKAVLEERLTRDQLLAMVVSRANAIVMISDVNDKVEWVNDEFTKITGYQAEEVIGRSPDFLRGPDTSAETLDRIAANKKSGISFHDEILNYTKHGKPVWLKMHVTPLTNDVGEIEHFVAIQEDITESKKTGEELRKSREQLRSAQRQAKIGGWEWPEQGEYLQCSEELCRILDMPWTEQLPVSHVRSYIHPEDLPVLIRSVQDSLKRNSPFELDCRILSGGHMRYIYVTGQPNESNSHGRSMVGTIQDITERKRTEDELRVAEKQYRSLFEYSQHMICMHDLDGVILSINPAGAHALGYEPEELIGRQIEKLVPVRYRGEFQEYINHIRTQGMHSGLMRMTLRSGEESIWIYSNIRLIDPEGQPFVLSSNVEITSRYLMEKELRQAKKLADDSLIAKDRFVANISHELRTPMNAIGGFTELLRKTKLNPEQKEYSDAIFMATENLTAMINDILDVAKIEAGKIEFERRVFDVRDVLRKTHILLSTRADKSGIQFTWTCDSNVPPMIVSDDLRLTQILVNLVGNAVKFTEKGFVNFGCDVVNTSDRQMTLRFWVEDSGIGIPKEKLEMIFDPFNQASASANRKYGGTGLGLTIVKDLAELQGGSVRVQSAEGIGSRFEVQLPVEKIDTGMVKQVDTALTPLDHPGHIHVLLVEDHPLNQQLALRLIRDFGFTASLAANGRAAIEVLKEERFDVILMDLQMPEMDGYETVNYLRERMGITTPVIALTAHSSSGEREKCLALGMDDYMTKPYRSKDLYYKIVSAISNRTAPEQENPASDENAYATPLKALAAGDNKFELEILETMLNSFPDEFRKLELARDQKLNSEIRAVAHRLKSSVALAGEKELTEVLQEVETLANGNDNDEKLLKYVNRVLDERADLINRITAQAASLR